MKLSEDLLNSVAAMLTIKREYEKEGAGAAARAAVELVHGGCVDIVGAFIALTYVLEKGDENE